jgi:glycosyltransferase involved in cell wall biosynthesis
MATTDYESTVRSLGLQDRVHFLGYVSDGELKALYKHAIAYVFPSLWEGFGLPILEAYSCGCPVLASNAGALPEVGGKAAIYVNPESENDLADGLRRMTKFSRSRFAGEAKRQIRRFSWDRSAKEMLKIYRQL